MHLVSLLVMCTGISGLITQRLAFCRRLADSGGKGQDVQQHGQDCRCSKDSRTVKTGGQHREDDGESAHGMFSRYHSRLINMEDILCFDMEH